MSYRLIDANDLNGKISDKDYEVVLNAPCIYADLPKGLDGKYYGLTKRTKGEWIPVTERLPEEKGEYLVTYHPCYWDDVRDAVLVGIDTFRGKTTWAKMKHQRVIAWMPLPEPYKADKESEA